MFWLVARDGNRTPIEAVDMWEAMREALRFDQDLLIEGDADRVLGRSELLEGLQLGRPGLFDSYTPDWTPPTTDEFRELLRLARLTGSQAGLLTGVGHGKIRRWAGGDNSPPYAVWRLLVIYARQATPDQINIK